MDSINQLEYTKTDEMYANELAGIIGMTRTELDDNTKTNLEIAKQLRLEQFLIETFYTANDSMELSIDSINQSILKAMEKFKLERKGVIS